MTQFSSVDYRYANGEVGGYTERLDGGVGGGGDAPIAPPRPPPTRNVVRADPASFGDNDDRLKRRQEQRRERERTRIEQDLPLEKKPIMKELAAFKNSPSDKEALSSIRDRPFAARCCQSCCLHTYNQLDTSLATRPLRDVLRVDNIYKKQNIFVRNVCLLYHVTSRRVVVTPHNVLSSVLNHHRVLEAVHVAATEEIKVGLESSGSRFRDLQRKQESRARKVLKMMAANASSALLRLAAWLLLRLLRFPFDSVVYHEGQLQLVKEALQKEVSLVFLPLHRSHMDYVLLQLFMVLHEIPVPLIAAGENLDMPFIGSLMRWLGGFFIKRKIDETAPPNSRDVVYRSVLHTYVEQLLKRNSNLLFFLEGGRSRSGKTLMPKCGLLSVLVHSLQTGVIPDAYIVPVAISYDRIVEGDFNREQMGHQKPKESFLATVKSAFSMLTKNSGSCRINICQPFSLQEFVSSNTPRQNDEGLEAPISGLSSPISRFGSATDLFGEKLSLCLTDVNRKIIKKLAAHAAYDATRGTPITAPNIVAFLLLTKFRNGASVDELAAFSKRLHRDVEYKGICFSFSGELEAVVAYGITLLGEHLVLRREKPSEASAEVSSSSVAEETPYASVDASGDATSVALIAPASSPTPIIYQPNLSPPFAVELLYYANPLVNVFALESAVALAVIDAFETDVVALKALRKDSGNVERETILRGALFIAELLQNEFLWVPPCASLDDALNGIIENFVTHELLSLVSENDHEGDTWRQRHMRKTLEADIGWDYDTDEDEDTDYVGPDGKKDAYHMGGSQRLAAGEDVAMLSWYASILAPHLTSYSNVAQSLTLLSAGDTTMKELISEIQSRATQRLRTGRCQHPESVGLDMIRNCLRSVETMEVVQTYPETDMIGLTDAYCRDECELKKFADKVDKLLP